MKPPELGSSLHATKLMNELEIMKSWKAKTQILLCWLILNASQSLCLAHDNTKVHPAISDSAAQSSSGLTNFLTECFGYPDLSNPQLSYKDPDGAQSPQSPIGWIKQGSIYEDMPWWRSNNHFYDPTEKPAIGLTDGVNFGGQPSFTWATVEMNAIWWQHSYTWSAARAYEFN